jgi:small subunit ribosomal protein S18
MADPNVPQQPPAAAPPAESSAPAEKTQAAPAPAAESAPAATPSSAPSGAPSATSGSPSGAPSSTPSRGPSSGGYQGNRGPSRGPGGPGGGPGGRPGPGGPHKRGKRNYVRKKKVCRFCVDRVDYIDYKKADILAPFIQERGKILPRRMTGTCARHQRWLTVAIKRAQNIALLPFAAEF